MSLLKKLAGLAVGAAKTPDFDAPNVNPVELGHVEVSRTPDGKIDPTQIVDPAVVGDWEEQGCKG